MKPVQSTDGTFFQPPEKVELNDKETMALGRSLFHANRLEEAFDCFSALSDACPDNWDAPFMAAHMLCGQFKFEEALGWYDRAMAIALTEANQVCLNKAVALGELGRSAEGIAILEGMVARLPNDAHAFYNLGVLYMQTDRFEEALGLFQRSIDLDPTAAKGDSIYCKGFANLVLGNYIDGFKGFENRLKDNIKGGPAQGRELKPDNVIPWWQDGHADIQGKTVLVLSEMGRGDMIQFGRYLPMLVKLGATVLVVADRGTEALYRGLPGVTIFTPTDVLPAADYWCHMMGLAHVFQTTVDTVPPPLPLTYDDELIAKWREIIPEREGVLKVGLCWAGNPESRYDNHRTIPLEMLRPMLDLVYRQGSRHIQFYNLQQGLRDCDVEAHHTLPLIDIGHHFTDFRETAHAMKCLDLVITVDTSVAHMAGTVGVPTWILVTRYRTYWLWIKGRNDTPWYSSVELIRQPILGDWPSTIEVVRDRLLGMLAAD